MLNTSKIQFKSNSQLECAVKPIHHGCAQYFKDTIQKQFTTFKLFGKQFGMLCSILQRYNSKAIHNWQGWIRFSLSVVLNTSKIQFKSNSQLVVANAKKTARCAQYFKDTIQKQFTTGLILFRRSGVLCSILQRYNSKAIHNWRLELH